MKAPEVCPHCGTPVPPQARACPHCGADAETGWAEAAEYATAADLGLPDEDFNYDEFVQREFGPRSPKPRGLHWVWWLVGLALVAVILFTWIL
ncbi:MAG: zinc-ribbon domain-containing protein [Verrucomicrobiae bacterium]|nr:zinc-ribbon domain-containing protein [Verrucomicrobiae bacterium]